MRKNNLFILLTVLTLVLAINEAMATKIPMPDIKGQFNKQSLKSASVMEMQADTVSFNSADNQGTAQGNVVVTDRDQILYCDRLQLYRTVQEAVAQGHVYLDTPQEQVIADAMNYNFNTRTGSFHEARVFAEPYQIKGHAIAKVSATHMTMDQGFMTTCDLDEPHFRISARRMDIYQKDKAVIRDMKIYLGKFPIMYMPYYVQDLKNRPLLTFEPGEKKEFGLFLLTSLRLVVGSHVKLTLHFDMRERTGFGEGFDMNYDTPSFGKGLLTAYYTDENMIASDHLWDLYRNGVKVGPTTHHERYRFRWRHQIIIDKNTNMIWQVYKIHDYDILNNGFLKNYFPREYNQNADVNNYFLLTHVMPHGTLTLGVNDSRINRELRGVDRFPELTYTFDNQPIGDTGFYAKSVDTYSNLSYQDYPKTFNEKTQRVDTNNDISHPFRVGFIAFNPHIGGENTYYSRTNEEQYKDIVRGVLRTSLDISTKFYKVWRDFNSNFAGLNINGLSHVITPTLTYLYQARPTYAATGLNQFDQNIDDLYRINQLELGLEDKWQTKRNGKLVDLLRVLVTSNFGLPETTGHRGFNPVDSITDFNPSDWLTLHNENEYDFHRGHFNADNMDAIIHFDDWSFAVGNLYTRTQSDQLTTEFRYRINPKWAVRVYDTFPLTHAESGTVYSQSDINPSTNMTGLTSPGSSLTTAREHVFVITRDLHEWQVDFSIDSLEKQGTTFLITFRLKAFPNLNLNAASTTFPESRPGAQ